MHVQFSDSLVCQAERSVPFWMVLGAYVRELLRRQALDGREDDGDERGCFSGRTKRKARQV